MKQPAPDVDSIPRWRDRGEGGASDEDRAAALVRAAVGPEAFSVGLDEQRLAAIEKSLNPVSRPRPPFWLRPAVVATLLTLSVASVMGYESGWFAPLRERLRFRSIPSAGPAPVGPGKRRAGRPQASGTENLSPNPATTPAASPAPLAKTASAPPMRKMAVAEPAAPSRSIAPSPVPTEASEEIRALEQAVGLLRGQHDAPAALAALDGYLSRFPGGVLAREARVARIDALLMLGRSDEALRALEELPLDTHRRSTELQLIRGELRARDDCARAEEDFTAVLARDCPPALEERALYGRATCSSALGNAGAAADDLRRYVERFPNGAHAGWARRRLENNP